MGFVFLTGGNWLPVTTPTSGAPFTGVSVVLSGPVPVVAGDLSIFFSERAGVHTGRVESEVVDPEDGDHLLSLGSERENDFALRDVGDEISALQNAARGTSTLVSVLMETRGPARVPLATKEEPFVLADGQTLVISVGGTEHTLTLDAADFDAIGAATGGELANVIERDVPGVVAIRAKDGHVLVLPVAGGRLGELFFAGGTAAAAVEFMELAWLLEMLVDGTLAASRHVRPGRDRRLSDVSLPLASAVASPDFELRLSLLDNLGSPSPGGLYDIEVPGAWVDVVLLSEPLGIFLSNRDPEPAEDQVPADSLITLDVVSSGSAVDTTTVQVFVQVDADPEVLVFDGAVGFSVGWDDPGSSDTVVVPELYRIAIDRTTNLPSLVEVVVRVVGETVGGDTLGFGVSYLFVVEDLTPPAFVTAQGTAKNTVRVTFDEPVDSSSLDPSRYLFALVDVPAVSVVATGVTRVQLEVVDLELDVPATFGATYELTASGVSDFFDNVSGDLVTQFTAFTPATPAGRRFRLYDDLLPQVNRDKDVNGDLRRLLDSLQDVLDLVFCLLDLWGDILDPDRAPEDFLDAMLADLGNPFDFVLTENDKRKLIRILFEIYRQKGTEVGIVNVVRFFVGIEVTIELANEGGWILCVSELGVDIVLSSGDQALLYSFNVVSPVLLTDDERDRIIEIAEYMKPAHTHLLNLLEPVTPEVIDHVELGISLLGVDWSLH